MAVRKIPGMMPAGAADRGVSFRLATLGCLVLVATDLLVWSMLPRGASDLAVRLVGAGVLVFFLACTGWTARRARGADRRWRLLLFTAGAAPLVSLLVQDVLAHRFTVHALSAREPAYLLGYL